jgi:hypothetical protein
MNCDVCQREAAGHCSGCGALYCRDHGGERCFRCSTVLTAVEPRTFEELTETGFYTTERGSRYAGKGYLQCYTKPEMETIYLDDPGPPACHVCQGLARFICNNCQQLFCSDHRGGKTLCLHCARSSLLGVWVFLGALAVLAFFVLLSHLLGGNTLPLWQAAPRPPGH